MSAATHLGAMCLVAALLTHNGCDQFPSADVGTNGAENATEATAERVETVPVEIQDITSTVTMAGTVEGFETAELYAKVGGYVREVRVDIGDSIEEGQVLAVLNIPEMETELAQKQALIRQAEAEVEQAVQGVRQAEAAIATAHAALQQASAEGDEKQAQVRFRETEYQRQADLWESRSIRKEVVDAAGFQLEAAQAALASVDAAITTASKMVDSAEANLEKAKADQQAAEAHVEVARADAAYIEAMLRYSEIRAPFAGRVTHRWMHAGAFIQPAEGNSAAKPILTVARTDTVRVSLPIPMNKVRLLDVGDPATLDRVNVLPGETFTGQVSRFSASLDMNSRMMQVEIDLPNEDQRLLPGYYGYVTIHLAEHPQTPVVPSSALLTDVEGAYVVAVRDGTAHRTHVRPVFQDGEIVGLAAGDLDAGDIVVRAGGGQLADGQAVLVGAET